MVDLFIVMWLFTRGYVRWLEVRAVSCLSVQNSQVFRSKLFRAIELHIFLAKNGFCLAALAQVFEPYFQAILDFLPVPCQRTAGTEGKFAVLATCLRPRSGVWMSHFFAEPCPLSVAGAVCGMVMLLTSSIIWWFILPERVHIPIHLQLRSLLAK